MKRYFTHDSLFLLAAGVASAALLLGCGDDGKRGGGGSAGSGGTGAAGGTGGSGGSGGSGGGGVDVYDDPAGASGTRLARRYLRGGTGAFMTTDFWDSELAMACSFGTAADGTLRCLPNDALELEYSDSLCTQPVYQARPSEACGGWALEMGAYFRRTDTPAALTDGLIYYRSGSGCSSTAAPADSTYWVAEHVVSARFVRGEHADVGRAGGLVARYVEGEDGSRALVEARSGILGYTCVFDDDGRCIPPESAVVRHLDSGCSDPVAGYRSNNVSLIAIEEYDARMCDAGMRFHQVGDAVTPTQVYERYSNGTCAAATLFADQRFYRIGAEVLPESLPRASLVLEGEGSLLARRHVDGSGNALGAAHSFWDASRDEVCEPVSLPGGRFGCAPAASGRVVRMYYAEAPCLEAAQIGTTYCAGGPPRVLLESAGGWCRGVAGVSSIAGMYERGAKVGPAYFYAADTVACVERALPPSTDGYLIGAEITDSLPPLELATE